MMKMMEEAKISDNSKAGNAQEGLGKIHRKLSEDVGKAMKELEQGGQSYKNLKPIEEKAVGEKAELIIKDAMRRTAGTEGNIELIIRRIEENARKGVEDILLKAHSNSVDIMTKASEGAIEMQRKTLEDAEREIALDIQRIISEATLKSRRIIWGARDKVINRVFDETLNILSNIRTQGYRDVKYDSVLVANIVEAAGSIGTAEVEVVLDGDDRSILSEGILKAIEGNIKNRYDREVKVSLSEETISCLGGAMVRSPDGTVEINNTLGVRFDRIKGEALGEIYGALDGRR